MLKLSYSSYFNDPAFRSLKHALLYFDQIAISEDSFLLAFGDRYQHCRYLQLAPEEIREQLKLLEGEGLVKYSSTQFSGELRGNALADQVLAEGIQDLPLLVSDEDLHDLCTFMNVRPEFIDSVDIASKVSLITATICLRDAITSGRTPSTDNELVGRWVEIGCRALGSRLSRAAASQAHVDLARLSLSLSLPAFEFATFEDLLEARWRLRAELEALRAAFRKLATDVDSPPGSAEYNSQIKRLVEKKVMREVLEVERAARFSTVAVAKRLAGAAVLVGLQSIFPSVVRDWLLGLSLLTLPEAAKKEAARASAALSASPFSMLIKLRRVGAV